MADGRPYSKLSADLKKELEMSERQLAVAELYFVKHKTQTEIAAVLGVSQKTISNDIHAIIKDYRENSRHLYQLDLEVQLAKLKAVEEQAWLAWERSIGEAKRITKKKNSNGDWEETEQIDQLVGDPRFLTQIQASVDRQIRLLGLDSPHEIIINTVEGRLIKMIQEGRVTFDMLANDIGLEQTRRYFNMANVPLPDIIEGEVIEEGVFFREDEEDDDYLLLSS